MFAKFKSPNFAATVAGKDALYGSLYLFLPSTFPSNRLLVAQLVQITDKSDSSVQNKSNMK